jgi:hypothetical protein
LQVFLVRESAGAFASTGSHWVAAASPQREASESGLFAGRLWATRTRDLLRRQPRHGVAVGVHLARDRVADEGALHLAWPVGASRQALSRRRSCGGSTGRHACPSTSLKNRRWRPAGCCACRRSGCAESSRRRREGRGESTRPADGHHAPLP